MFVERTNIIFIEAVRAAMDAEHPFEKMQNISVRMEYPLAVTDYPCLWVNFIPQGDMANAGIGHVEYEEVDGGIQRFFRWTFTGVCEITVAALSSLERARMADWLAKTIAFGRPADVTGGITDLRSHVENNDLIGLNVLWDSFVLGGAAETPGTPWGGDDVIYEMTLSLTVEGEFRFNPDTTELVPLSAIEVLDPGLISENNPVPDPTQGWV